MLDPFPIIERNERTAIQNFHVTISTVLSTACFFRLALDPHYERLKEHFGKTVKAIFTDEPSVLGRGAIRDCLAGVGTRHPPYVGITGTIAFDSNGDPRPAYNLVEITVDGVRIVRTSGPEESP